eukprot:gnl/MRDRNA2_/MRDRNA2_87128_c0_seq1.p2 gnl/MRDRNA2_/MRDRNA2_87128_c0~~gnl/MRDRNA2_/MRDRNA2_87128_c0_seq1.p2  ORF type:complete len:218 (+),score=82.20 gnl/MRDRNA2_/MRDRNA2_87128_c0_seq1:162-815(+)
MRSNAIIILISLSARIHAQEEPMKNTGNVGHSMDKLVNMVIDRFFDRALEEWSGHHAHDTNLDTTTLAKSAPKQSPMKGGEQINMARVSSSSPQAQQEKEEVVAEEAEEIAAEGEAGFKQAAKEIKKANATATKDEKVGEEVLKKVQKMVKKVVNNATAGATDKLTNQQKEQAQDGEIAAEELGEEAEQAEEEGEDLKEAVDVAKKEMAKGKGKGVR